MRKHTDEGIHKGRSGVAMHHLPGSDVLTNGEAA